MSLRPLVALPLLLLACGEPEPEVTPPTPPTEPPPAEEAPPPAPTEPAEPIACPERAELDAILVTHSPHAPHGWFDVERCAAGHFPEPGWAVAYWTGRSTIEDAELHVAVLDAGASGHPVLAEISANEHPDWVAARAIEAVDLDGDGTDELLVRRSNAHGGMDYVYLDAYRRDGTALVQALDTTTIVESDVEAQSSRCEVAVAVGEPDAEGARTLTLTPSGTPAEGAECPTAASTLRLVDGRLTGEGAQAGDATDGSQPPTAAQVVELLRASTMILDGGEVLGAHARANLGAAPPAMSCERAPDGAWNCSVPTPQPFSYAVRVRRNADDSAFELVTDSVDVVPED